jgi:hypothetical protein
MSHREAPGYPFFTMHHKYSFVNPVVEIYESLRVLNLQGYVSSIFTTGSIETPPVFTGGKKVILLYIN